MPNNIIIPNPEKLEKTKKAIAKDGQDKLHILSDFDRTLTKTEIPSLIWILYNEKGIIDKLQHFSYYLMLT